jgi:hypothetical protein
MFSLKSEDSKYNNLEDIIFACESNLSMKEKCVNNSNFWKKLLQKYLGKWIIKKRNDINDMSLWYLFAKRILNGVVFRLTIAWDNDTETLLTPKPRSFYTINKQLNGDINYFDALIEGIYPKPGTLGYLLHFNFKNEKTNQYFLDNNLENLQNTVKEYIWKKSYETIQNNFLLDHKVKNLVVFNSQLGNIEKVPDEKFFKENVHFKNDQKKYYFEIVGEFTEKSGLRKLHSIYFEAIRVTF